MNWVPEGGYWAKPSLVWGIEAGKGKRYVNYSALGHEILTLNLLSDGELATLFAPLAPMEPVGLEHAQSRLRGLFGDHFAILVDELRSTTGYSRADCLEVVKSCESFLDRFERNSEASAFYTSAGRSIGIRTVAWGTIAAILPQNAFLSMALICLLNGLASGNRVILRAPSGSARLAAILGDLLTKAEYPPSSFSLVVCDAGQFVASWAASTQSILLHYMGSSARGPDLLHKSYDARKPVLVDGEGNAWVYVDRDQDPLEAARLIWGGAIRYNGQTCTSINGVFVHPDIDASIRHELRELVKATIFGRQESDQVGPLFTVDQAKAVDEAIFSSHGRLGRIGNLAGNLLPPTLIEDPELDSSLVSEGIFGPAMWVRTGDFEEFTSCWRRNRYPLCAGILSGEIPEEQALTQLDGASRIVINGDPSLEDPLEPWGAYPPCGSNPVSDWGSKYRRAVQVDRPA